MIDKLTTGARLRRQRGLVGARRPDVRDDGRPAALRGRQRGRPLRVHPARRRSLPGLAQQGRGSIPLLPIGRFRGQLTDKWPSF